MGKAKNMDLANRIKRLASGERFEISGKRERISACKAIRVLRDAGVLKLDVITRETDEPGKFLVIAL